MIPGVHVGFHREWTFELVADGRAIKCLACQRVSYHPEDVAARYCGFCHVFHPLAGAWATDDATVGWC